MKKISTLIKKVAATTLLFALAIGGSFGTFGAQKAEASAPWNATGNYVINQNYLGTDYPHDLSLVQDNTGNLTGNGGSPAGANVNMYTLTSGSVVGNSITFTANYTAPAATLTPQTTLTVTGTIAPDGTISGAWSDNYQGGARSGTFATVSGAATPAPVKVTIVKYVDGTPATTTNANSSAFAMSSTWNATSGSGTGTFNLSPTGFNNTNPYQATTSNMSSGASYTTNEVMDSTTGATCSTANPFSLVGYTSGDTLAAAAAATPSTTPPAMTNITTDKFVIVWNHDCANINMGNVMTHPATAITTSDATLNGMNGSSAAIGKGFWVSKSTYTPISGTSPAMPANVYSTGDTGATPANANFSSLLSSATSPAGLLPITPNTMYYFNAWTYVGGTWYPGAVMSFTTSATTSTGNVTTNPATAITTSGATLNGMNGSSAATGHSFWVSTSPFVTTSTTLPAGVYSTPDMGAKTANTVFSAPLSSVTGLPAITPNTTYYFAAWSNVGGTWYPGAVMSFTTSQSSTAGQGTLLVTSINMTQPNGTADNTFQNGWKYVFNVTVPTNEKNLSMKFADWVRTGGSEIIPAANNMRISSLQANNAGATVLITAANTYSTPPLTMVTDLNPSIDGMQVQVTVEVKIPTGSTSGSYTTSYGVQSQP